MTVRLGKQLYASTGIVEVYRNGSWYGLCGAGFTDTSAGVACSQLGYEHGKVLPQGAFGKYYAKVIMPGVNCTGNETSLLQCPYNEGASCGNRYYGYAVVSCYNGSVSQGIYWTVIQRTQQA